MKKHIYLSLLLGLLLFTTTSKSQAESYLGDFCWQIFENEVPAWVYKFGVYEKEGRHFALYGTDNAGGGRITAAHGNAEIVDSNIVMTVVDSGYEEASGAFNETFNAVLDIATLGGTWHSLGVLYDPSDNRLPFHSNGTLSLITCP